MKHIITRSDRQIEIRLSGIGQDSETILQRLGGQCTVKHHCSHDGYDTLASVEASSLSDGIALRLTSRGNASRNVEEAARCPDATVDHILADEQHTSLRP